MGVGGVSRGHCKIFLCVESSPIVFHKGVFRRPITLNKAFNKYYCSCDFSLALSKSFRGGVQKHTSIQVYLFFLNRAAGLLFYMCFASSGLYRKLVNRENNTYQFQILLCVSGVSTTKMKKISTRVVLLNIIVFLYLYI